MKSRALGLSPHLLLAGLLGLAAIAGSLVATGMIFPNASGGISWVTRVGTGLIGPACGSSSISGGAPTCSGATPVATVSWSSDATCDSSTAYLDVNGTNVGSGSCSGSYAWSGGAVNTGYTYEVWTNVSGSRHSISTGSFTTPTSCAPTATLSANPTTIDQGQSSTLTWGSTNATSCTAGGGFSTGGATSGNTSTGALSSTSIYQVTCDGLGGSSAPAFATVTVLVPSVSIGASPDRVLSGATTTVSWDAENVNSCAITRNNVAWQSLTADVNRDVVGNITDTITTQTTYRISCTNDASAGAAAATAIQTVNVVPGFEEF